MRQLKGVLKLPKTLRAYISVILTTFKGLLFHKQ